MSDRVTMCFLEEGEEPSDFPFADEPKTRQRKGDSNG